METFCNVILMTLCRWLWSSTVS